MKTITTLRNLLAVSLLLISILAGCKKDPTPQPVTDVFTWSDAPKSATDALKIKADSIHNNANNDRVGK